MELNKQPISINITSGTIFKTIGIFILFYFLYLISDILVLFFVSLFFQCFRPWVDKLKKKKIPRSVSVLMLYLIVFSLLGLALYLITPPIINEVNGMSRNLPAYIDSVSSKFSLVKDYSLKYGLLDSTKSSLDIVSGYLHNTASGVFFTLFNIFGGIFSFVLILVLTFYMVVEESAIKKLVWSIAPEQHQSYVMHLVNRMQLKMGHWLRGQVIVSLSLGIMSYVGLEILKLIMLSFRAVSGFSFYTIHGHIRGFTGYIYCFYSITFISYLCHFCYYSFVGQFSS